ncbi:DNA polymerase III subunit gamma/tau [Vibrio sinensis]|uniref:DNA polymerase III subunit gamma/tau n=1 Tax=Vibrio sinensis TaxID=2302434 RepID=A0A3A6RB28_9VIBR|nr:DNA polymerase III subunit gamma/tau [Vibrio sinensis]RJX73791.1 DNA polymerase III subunit gamma/tau [Vibrio sinensis]
MSYLALARKWRPTKFKEVVGQAHVLTALENALAQNRLHHAYLFSGTRGVGKTSIGRLFAKGLNCETGITATPCGECATCKEIDEGRFVDLLEIDAASRTKVEDTRELLDNVQYKPARGRFKVYLIDEVHMLSRHSFNALLKTLEEPPEYVKFILATTDPQKLPVTILSRCLQFHLKPISVDVIREQLENILSKENVTAENRALGMIAHAADGSMRDALSLTDQAIALGNGVVETDLVTQMLGTLDTDQAIHLLEAISAKDPQAVLDSVQKLAQNGVEWDGLLQQLATQLHRLAMYQALPSTLDNTQPDAEKVTLLARALSPEDVQLYYQIALKGRQDLPMAPSERIGLEMVMLRMLAFRPVTNVQANVISTQTNVTQVSASQANTTQVNATQVHAAQRQPIQGATQGTVAGHQPASTMAQPSVHQAPSAPRAATQSAPVYNEPPQYQAHSSMPSDVGQPDYDMMPPEHLSNEYQSMPTYSENTPPATQAIPTQERVQVTTRSTSPASGLRHQLRSQRNGLSNASSQAASSQTSKKVNAASAKSESVLERVAQKHGKAGQVSPKHFAQHQQVPDSSKDEAYRWKASLPQESVVVQELTPTQLKRALEHEKTPEMAEKLLQESVAQDSWSALVQSLDTAKLTQQLALNSYYEKNGSSILLTLRPQQAHLNTERAQGELLDALNRVLGEECHLSVTVGDQGETPLELREKLYQTKLKTAFSSLASDENVNFIQRRFAAELDNDSVRPI